MAARPVSPFMPHQTGPLTALQLTQTILAKSGAANPPQTIDHVSAGDPLTGVTGIAVTELATLDVLQRAAADGHNLIVTYDPGFWSTSDSLDGMEGNALFVQKRDFIRDHHLVVFNLHDHWQGRVPDGLNQGMAALLGWPMPKDGAVFAIPDTTLLALARHLADKLRDRTMRVVGDPALPVRQVAMALGNATQMPTIALLNGAADVVMAGYSHEWEAVEYAQDMVASGQHKGMILIGEVPSAAPGMKACAEWIKTIIDTLPITYLAAGEAYWSP